MLIAGDLLLVHVRNIFTENETKFVDWTHNK